MGENSWRSTPTQIQWFR